MIPSAFWLDPKGCKRSRLTKTNPSGSKDASENNLYLLRKPGASNMKLFLNFSILST